MRTLQTVNQAPLPKYFILDFDGTITTKDTIQTVFKSALSFQKERGKDMKATWQEITTSYDHDYELHVENYEPLTQDRNSLEAEVAFYRALRDIETRSFDRVSRSGIFEGISKEKWEEFGRKASESGQVSLRNGFESFVESIRASEGTWGVISVNFSAAFIRGVLSLGAERKGIHVLANQPERSGIVKGPKRIDGTFGKVLITSEDKFIAMNDLLTSWDMAGKNNEVGFIGDSGTDIECLTHNQVVGIMMSNDGNGNLIHIMNRLGMEVVYIGERKYASARSIFWARNFEELL
jgi:2-hydroxy-3-keto-5-methylthiopentenyl-1-phosphate phosphatase